MEKERIKIRLSEKEQKYDDFSDFIETLEDKYGFNQSCRFRMSCEILNERSY